MRLAYRGPDIVIAMANLTVEGTDVVVHLSGLEKLAAFRGDVRLPAAAVRAVAVEPNPWGALRGIRSPGTGWPGVIAYGARRHRGGRDFAAVLGRRPAVRLELDPPSPFGRVVVSVADAGEAVARVRSVATGLRADG
jgi:hypothetical protein